MDDFLKGETNAAPPGPPPSSGSSGGFRSASSYFSPVGNPPSARVLTILSPCTFICLMVGVFRLLMSAVTGGKVSLRKLFFYLNVNCLLNRVFLQYLNSFKY